MSENLQLRRVVNLQRRYFTTETSGDGISREEWKLISDCIYNALLPFDDARWAVAAALASLDKETPQKL